MRLDWVSVALILVALAVTAALYPQLPAEVPRHWNVYGQADAWAPRWWTFAPAVAAALVYGLLSLFPLMDRRGALAARPGVYRLMVRGVVLVLLLVHFGALAAALGYPVGMPRLTGAGVGLLLMLFGNHLPQLKPNHFAGLKTPWTMKDEAVWRITHRAGSYVMMVEGALLAILSLLLRAEWVFGSMLAVVLGLLVFSFVYSYLAYAARHPGGH